MKCDRGTACLAGGESQRTTGQHKDRQPLPPEDLIRNLHVRLESDESVTKNSERGATFLLGVRQEADRTLLLAAGARSRSNS